MQERDERAASGSRTKLAKKRDPNVGRVVAGRYQLLERLGEGGMGTVYRARRASDGRVVALKVLAPHHEKDPTLAARFRREAETTRQLTHPHIVDVSGFVADPDGRLMIEMELLQGRRLLDRLREGPLSVDEAMSIAVQVASALEVAHAAGVIHRDLTPSNVFLVPHADGGEAVKLLDFGIAKLRDEGVVRLTSTGVLIGTPRYASPEQVRGLRDVDGRSDLFSLGVLLYCMLGGRPPFMSHAAQLLIDIESGEPPDLRTLAPHVPAGLAAVVRRAMLKPRELRFPNARAMRLALEAVASGQDTLNHETTPDAHPLCRWAQEWAQARTVDTDAGHGPLERPATSGWSSSPPPPWTAAPWSGPASVPPTRPGGMDAALPDLAASTSPRPPARARPRASLRRVVYGMVALLALGAIGAVGLGALSLGYHTPDAALVEAHHLGLFHVGRLAAVTR